MRNRCKWMMGMAMGMGMILVAGPADAVSFVDIDIYEKHMSAGDVIFGVFDIVYGDEDEFADIKNPYDLEPISDMAGFDPLAHLVTEATVKLYLRDDRDWGYPLLPQVEFAISLVQGGGVRMFEVSHQIIEFGSTINLRGEVQDDGRVLYTVGAVLGDFYFDYALLQVTAEPKDSQRASIPDGGLTLSLLGAAMLFVERFRRRTP